MKSNQNPKVYVGTYHKYNCGSIYGAWIDLAECATYAEFIKKCREVHKDEPDPELMIQDYDFFPDGLSCMEWLSEAEFNDVISAFKDEEEAEELPKFQIIDYSEKAIAIVGDTMSIKEEFKKLGGRYNPRLSCGAGWVFPKSKSAEVQSIIGCTGDIKTNAEKQKVVGNPYKAVLEEYLAECKLPSDITFYGKNNIGAVRSNYGYILIPKPDIENKFCFRDEGADYEAYKEIIKTDKTLERYFLSENLDTVDRKIRKLEGEARLFVSQPRDCNGKVYWYEGMYGEKRNDNDIEMPNELRKELIKAYKVSRALFEKRLKNYLKRYGTSHIHTWTYWADA